MGFHAATMSTMAAKESIPAVQVYGRKKTATAVAHCKRGNGLIKVNGRLLEHIEPRTLQYKLMEPILLLGKARFSNVTIRFVSRVVATLHRSMLSDKPSQSLWLHIIRSLL